MLKLPKADLDNDITWTFVLGTIVVVLLIAYPLGYGMGLGINYLFGDMMRTPTDPSETGLVVWWMMLLLWAPMMILFRFMPGKARQKQINREEIARLVQAYNKRYPDDPPVDWNAIQD